MGRGRERAARARIIICGVLLAFIAGGCAGTAAVDLADAGRTRAYEPGVPNFDMEAVVRISAGASSVDVYNSIPFASLVYVKSGDRYEAEYDLVVQLLDRESKAVLLEKTELRRFSVSDFDSTQSYRTRVDVVPLDVSPGSYVVDVMLTDERSQATARRRQSIQIPEPGSEAPFVSRILVEGLAEDGEYAPVVSLHMPAMVDSLRATIQVFNLSRERPTEILMRLVRFATDTTVASPPYWLAPGRGSLAYLGAHFDRGDTLQVTRRPVGPDVEDAEIVFSLPSLMPGIHELRIEARRGEGEEILGQSRILSVKNEAFPEMAVLDDLIEALAYIAFEREIAEIRSAETPAEKKRRFDAFWGSLVPNRNAAANLIKLYYGRIEEANLFFTGYKEGWKTDRGMIYTILGPPLYVDRSFDTEVWHYSYSERDPVNTFVFERVQPFRDEPFDNFILQRRPYYQNEWSRAVDRWREGQVL